MKADSLYTIEGFNTEKGQGMGGYGFAIVLAEQVVSALLELKRESGERLTEMLNDRIKNSGVEYDIERVDYFNDTWLLTGLKVGGNCACFGIDGNARSGLRHGRRAIRYSPHNIDSPQQAAVILSTWLLWFNTVLTLTKFEQPYAS